MNIAFLHIGDIHLKNKNGLNLFQTDKIVDSLNSTNKIDYIIIVISGDIAYSGKKDQYTLAKRLLGRIISKIKRDFDIGNRYRVICVPGNHDVDHSKKLFTNKMLQGMLSKWNYDEHIPVEIEKQKGFFDLANYNRCFKEDDKILDQEIIDINGFKIEANLVNSATFSIKEEDKGLHYIPQYCINKINTPTNADFVITVMHHNIEWYNDAQKLLLESAVYGKSSIVFYGHEHCIVNKTVSHEKRPMAVIQAGGVLCNNDDWRESTFYIGILNTDDLSYEQSKFIWNDVKKIYEKKDNTNYILPSKPSKEESITVVDEFKTKLKSDSKHNISESFMDYFVFPRIQEEISTIKEIKEFTMQEDFIAEIIEKKRVLIRGGYNSGKSALLKALFISLSEKYITIFYDASNIYGKKAERVIKNAFEEIYGEDPADYQRFLQIPKNKKILIIDNIDYIKSESLENLLTGLDSEFEYFIFSSKQVFDLDIVDRMKSYLDVNGTLTCYKILPLFADKREELIEKIVTLKSEDKENIIRTTRVLSEAIKSQRRFISLEPDFVIKYVEYYCNNIGDAHNNDNGVFNKVFEANLTNSLKDYQTVNLSVDKLFVLLSKIAYYIHFNKAYPITEDQIYSIVNQYKEDYGSSVKYADVINAVTSAKVLISDDSGNYRFANRSYLAYYVAREVNNRYNTTGDNSDLQTILKNACFGINSDVLLFISYITDNIRIQKLILQMANQLTEEWDEFDFTENMPEYLKNDYKPEILPPTEEDCKEAKSDEIDRERYIGGDLQMIDIYDYTDEDADIFINQIIRASSLLMLTAKCLPNFEHNMLKEDKDAFIDTIYRLPNKIFSRWAGETNKCVDECLEFFKQQSQDYYTRTKPVKEEDIMAALQWASLSLLLDLYNIAVYYSTKDNTLAYLSSYSYVKKETYRLEHLMMLSKMKSIMSFKDEAIAMKREDIGSVYDLALKRVVRHGIIYSDNMKSNVSDKLIAEFFPNKKASRDIKIRQLSQKSKKRE